MSTLQQNIHNYYSDNPIRWREILTLRRQRGKWFWRVMYGLSAFIMLIPVLWGGSDIFMDAFNFTIVALIIANMVAYILVVLRGVLTANDAIQRERRDNTWDLLMLTGVSRWQLILGKWFGVLRIVAVDYLWLFLLRLGIIFWAVGQTNANQISYNTGYYDWSLSDFTFGSDAWGTVLLLLVIFTVLEWGFNTALGIGMGFFQWKARTSTGAAVGIRVALGILPPIITYVLLDYADGGFFNGFYSTYGTNFINFIFRFVTIFADNGIFSALFEIDRYQPSQDYFVYLRWGTWAGMLTYPVLTVGALLLANNRAAARGTNADEYVGTVKPKRKRKEPSSKATTSSPAEKPIVQTHSILPGTENIFALEHATAYRAEVYSYQRRLGRLYLRLQRDEDIRYVRISGVSYLEAPVAWKGAHFDAATQPAYEAFLAEKGLTINSLQAEHMRLYRQAGNPLVQVVGSTVELLEELPANV